MAQNFVIGGTTYNGVDSISMTNENGEKITYVEKTNPGTGVPVATIGSREFYTVEDALKEAVSGETVMMIADSNEPADLIIPSGVTLNLQSNTLTVDSIIGMDGSFLTANAMKTNGTGSGIVVIEKENLLLSQTTVSSQQNMAILPIWVDNCYKFAAGFTTKEMSGQHLTVTEDAISLQFRHRISSYYKSMMSADGGAVHGLRTVVKMRWETDGASRELVDVFDDDKFKEISDDSHDYTWNMPGYTEIGIDLSDGVYLTMGIIADCGVETYHESVRVQM